MRRFLRYWYHRLWKTAPRHPSWRVTYPDGLRSTALYRDDAESRRRLFGGHIEYVRDDNGDLI